MYCYSLHPPPPQGSSMHHVDVGAVRISTAYTPPTPPQGSSTHHMDGDAVCVDVVLLDVVALVNHHQVLHDLGPVLASHGPGALGGG